MSRKLIYVSGLLACYRCHLDYLPSEREKLYADGNRRQEVIEHLGQIFRMTPLELIASVLRGMTTLAKPPRKSWAHMTNLSACSPMRPSALASKMTEEEADEDETYQRARALSHTFRDGLLEFFFDPQSEMGDLTRNYGVF